MANVVKLYYVDTGATYKQWELLPNKLLVIDSIADYLATKSAMTISNFQYVKNELEIGINVDLAQSYSEPKTTTSFKYVSIQNDGEQVHYYFIKKIIWRSKSAVRLELIMDVLNTFKEGTDYIFKENTRIAREHKDRIQFSRLINRIGNKPYSSNPSLFNEFGHFISPDIICEWFAEEENFGRIVLFEITGSNYGGLMRGLDSDDAPALECYKVKKNNLEKTFICECAELGQAEQDIVFLDENGDDVATIPSIDFENYYLGVMVREDIPSVDDSYWETPSNFVWIAGGDGYGTFYYQIIGILEQGARYQRKIDLYSEGLNPILYGEEKGEITEDGNNWYLVYKDASLKCYLTSDLGFDILLVSGSNEIVASDLVEGNYYYVLPERNENRKVSIVTNENFYVSSFINKNVFGVDSRQQITFFYKDGANIKVGAFGYDNIFGWRYTGKFEYTTTKIKILSNYKVIKTNILTSLNSSISAIRNGSNQVFNLTNITKSVWPFSALNRRDSTLVKIIKLPYRPTDEAFTGWKYDDDSHMIYLDNLDVNLENSFDVNYNPLSSLFVNGDEVDITDLRNDIYESKLYHSDYYQPKFVYDSFSFIFTLERINMSSYVESSQFNIVFKASNTINSRFLFSFPNYQIEGKLLEDYSNILIVARNNDVPYYTDSYMTYIKTGFNYDVKSKQRQEAGTWIGTALSLVGSIASFASSGITGGFGILSGITFGTTAISQLVNAVNTTAQAEANQSQKLLQLKHQQSSVASADDVDLMSAYTNNKAKWMLYRVSERMEKLLANLFFYAGYSADRMGLPIHNTRVNFDYLECEASIEKVASIPDDCLNELINCFKIGVTYLHKTTRELDKWDFEQKYENWEINLLGE